MRTKVVTIISSLFALCMLALPLQASAVNLFGDACSQSGSKDSAACTTSGGDPITTTLNKVTVLVGIVAGAAAIILLSIAGFMFVTSEGDASKVANARRTVVYTVVGLLVIVFARGIIGFVISRV